MNCDDHAEDPDYPQLPQRPDEEEHTFTPRALIDTRTSQMNDGHRRRKEPDQNHHELARKPLAKNGGPVNQDGRDSDADHVHHPGLIEPVSYVVNDMER